MKLASLCIAASLAFVAAGCTVSTDDGTGTSDEELSSAEHAAYKYFKGKGLTDYQAAGIVGNLIQESSVNPNAKEYGGGPGRGIAQWSVGGRWDTSHDDNMTWYASKHGVSRWSLDAQLDFVWYELHDVGGYGLSALKNSSNVTAATVAFEKDFEGCGTCDQSKRIAYAKQVLQAFK